MKIGTLSFEIRGKEQSMHMVLPSAQRRELVIHVASTYSPDLLLCAGWTVAENVDLDQLAQDNRISTGKSILILEVEHSAGEVTKPVSNHEMFLVEPGRDVRSLGRQVIQQSADLKGEGRSRRIHLFEDRIPEKSATIYGHKLFALCCGEINVLKSRKIVVAQLPAAELALLSADIVVNPTHDRMGNAGTLIAKRKWLSQFVNGRNRIYISASNWNTDSKGRKQRFDSGTLHSVYFSGEMQKMTFFPDPDGTQRYMYRQCEIAL